MKTENEHGFHSTFVSVVTLMFWKFKKEKVNNALGGLELRERELKFQERELGEEKWEK